MDLWIIGAVVLLVAWAVGTFALAAGGWIHLLLTVGVFMVLWRIIVHGTPEAEMAGAGDTPGRTPRTDSRKTREGLTRD